MDIMHNRLLELIGTQHGAVKALAEHLGVSGNNVTNWKAGRSDSYKKYAPQIADYYGVSLDWLSGRTDEKSIKKEPAAQKDDALNDALIIHRGGRTRRIQYTAEQWEAIEKLLAVMPSEREDDEW